MAGPGRPKGLPNKMGLDVKEAFMKAFHFAQLDDRSKLQNWAVNNPDKFYPLIAKFVPIDIDVTNKNINVNISMYANERLEHTEGEIIEHVGLTPALEADEGISQ